jgi:hypothetical protein
VADGPHQFTRNPISIGMSPSACPGAGGLAIGFDNLWVLAMLVPFYLVIRYAPLAPPSAIANALTIT